LVSLLSVTGLSRSSWLLLMGMRELRVEQEDGEGEVSLLLVDKEGMLVLRGRPEGFRRPRLSSRWIGETELRSTGSNCHTVDLGSADFKLGGFGWVLY